MAGRWRSARLAELIEQGELPAGTKLADVDEQFHLIPSRGDVSVVSAAGTSPRPRWVAPEVADHSSETPEEGNDRRIAELSALVDKLAAALSAAIDSGNASLVKATAQALALTTDRYRVTAGLAVTRSEQKSLVLNGRISHEQLQQTAARLQGTLRQQIADGTAAPLAIEGPSE